MPTLEHRLVSLVDNYALSSRDAALIALTRDHLKPAALVGACTRASGSHCKPEVCRVLHEFSIPFSVRHGRIAIGHLDNLENDAVQKSLEPALSGDFGFPICCMLAFERQADRTAARSPYVFHVPCCAQCKETHVLEEEYRKHIRAHYPELAKRTECS